MKPTIQIANRFREVVLNGKWIANTNLKDQLTGLSWEQATKKIGSLNTLAVLTFHIHYYLVGIVDVLEGRPLIIRDKYSFDAPPVQSQEDWEKLLRKLWIDAEKFAMLVEQMPEEKLNEVFSDEKYGTYQRNIDGMIEHCYYHLGQIVLIRKMLSTSE
ncbi:MAG: DUF1572 domain-containing protein [Chitinophagaceae bacterium]